MAWAELPHLVAYHYVGDLGLAVHIFMFLFIGDNWEDEVAWFTLALPHQETPSFAFVCEQFLCISPRQVSMIPPGEDWQWIYQPYHVTIPTMKINK